MSGDADADTEGVPDADADTDGETDPDPAAGDPAAVDPEAMLDELIRVGAVTEEPDGTLHLTPEFDDTLDLYEQSYLDLPEEAFLESVADAFGLEPAEAEARVASEGVTREEFVAYLAVASHFEDRGEERPAPVEQATMASLVTELTLPSPVPPELEDVTADPEAFIEGHERAVLFVWKHHCDPCTDMKNELPETLERLPADVSVAGVDGEAVPDAFRARFDVTAAPAVLCVRDGEQVDGARGYGTPTEIEELVANAL